MSTRLNSPNINAEEKALILRLAAERKSAIDIAAEVGVSVTVVYKTCQRAGKSIREIQYPGSMAERGPVSEEVKKTASRPAAEYSNKSAWGIATEYNNQKTAI
ncbi:MAG TPA: hypothetical protein VL727_29170 [Puia sp.]|nr:hypothetical protein [Puia sp.]